MRRLWWMMALVLAMLVLGACGSESEAEQPTDEPRPIATRTPQPTLDINAIPVLGEENPPPPIPLNINDSRYPIQPATGDSLTEGKALYDRFCAACHGIDGAGEQPDPYAVGAAPPHDDTGHTWHHADQQNFATVWNGANVNAIMPSYHDRMTSDEIIAVLSYIKLWWIEDQLASQLDLTQRVVDGVSGSNGE